MGTSRKRSLLDGVHAQEINWSTNVQKIICEPQRRGFEIGFVYLMAEDDGPFKIGSANHPITRLRALQTGNPRLLKLEHLIIGTLEKERLLQLWAREFVVPGRVRQRGVNGAMARDTEWFDRAGLEEVGAMFEAIADVQLRAAAGSVSADMEQATTTCLNGSDREIVYGDTVRLIGAASGYVELGMRAGGGRKSA